MYPLKNTVFDYICQERDSIISKLSHCTNDYSHHSQTQENYF